MNFLKLLLNKGLPEHLIMSTGDYMFSDLPYRYSIAGKIGNHKLIVNDLEDVKSSRFFENGNVMICIEGCMASSIRVQQTFVQPPEGTWLEETLTLTNLSGQVIQIDELQFGFRRSLSTVTDWRLIAVPFRIQVDGKVHDYSVSDLIAGRFSNSDQKEHCWTEEGAWPRTIDEGRLRSEAWLWTNGQIGLMIAKYNNDHIEMSLAEVEPRCDTTPSSLRFGGVGLSLYSEPRPATRLVPGGSFTFGITRYELYCGPIAEGYQRYKSWINEQGHGFPADYNPPLVWNELYDIGWHFCDQEKLRKFYTRDALLEEARKATEIGCELLYLDPGWEVCEGATLWDELRLGQVGDFVQGIKSQFGLDVGYRTIGQVYRDEFPHRWYCLPSAGTDRGKSGLTTGKRVYWRYCSCCREWHDEKARRIRTITEQGMKFMMFDEYSWFGPCVANDHGHSEPTTPEDHVRAVYGLIEAMHKARPDVLVEAHDPIWSWFVRYLPVYFRQGFCGKGSYEENWGFEFMWDCIEDLRQGRARALYYYAMGTDIPLYLHLSMVTDNDQCLFFWWAASTVRHLGIGGKYHNFQPELRDKHCADVEARWSAYKRAVKLYKSLKPYFVRGIFHGLSEEGHLHTHSDRSGGVLNLYNLSHEMRRIEAVIPAEKIRLKPGEPVEFFGDVNAQWAGDRLIVWAELPAWSPLVAAFGEALYELDAETLGKSRSLR